jgi:hypothetical protein
MKDSFASKLSVLVLSVSFGLTQISYSQNLENGFRNPPESAKPRTWWHWTNGNITKEGITKDLEWMKRIGIGGVQLADVAAGQGQSVEKKLLFGSPEWLDAVHHAASEADRLNLEMTIFSSPGWSLTGGPWVKPEQAMKKLVWSEVNIKGPFDFKGPLLPLPSIEGPIRNMSRSAQPGKNDPQFSRDCLLLAFPTPSNEDEMQQLNPVITTPTGIISGEAFMDNDLNTSQKISAGKDKKTVWIEFSFEKPFVAQALTLASRNGIPVGKLKVSDDGIDFHTVAVLPGPQLYRAGKVETISFKETSGRYFRLEFTGAPMKPAEVMAETGTLPDSIYSFSEIRLHSGARVNRWEDKAGFFHLFNYDPVASTDVSALSAVDPLKIIDLTSSMQPDGSLTWKVPPGNWTIMRFGYSLTGSKNRPAVSTGSGYEVDKLSRENTEAYIRNYTDPIREALGPLYGKSLQYVVLDSWEAGMQNWTDKMIGEFSKRRGYDPTPYIPCLAGRVIGSSEISDRFLWDFRRTLADMFAENHYKTITEYLHNQNIKTYGEASGVSLEILEDALLCKKYVDIPMGEFWYRALHPELMYYQDIRGAASAAHIYGKKIVAAESFTGGGFESPYTLKKIGDYWFTQGINRIVFHTSAHQPLDSKPGNTMVGTHINRNITWAEQAEPFMKYLARVSFMLQQGRSVGDLVYLLNEGAPSTMPIWGSGLDPAPPEGFDYDYINAEALVNSMSVDQKGRFVLPDSVSYRLLVLPNTDQMTLPVLQKIHDLVAAGATVTGKKPVRTPGLTGFPASEKKLQELVFDLWGDLDGISRTQRSFGKGRVIWGMPLSKVLSTSGISCDVEFSIPADKKLSWIHRTSEEGEIYFIVNGNDTLLNGEIRFRVAGMEPEIWNPSDGSIVQAGYTLEKNKTVVPLHLSERQSVFIVFRNKARSLMRNIPDQLPTVIDTLQGPWEISFPAGMGAPEKALINRLESWTANTDEGIKYFSGTATYFKTFNAPKRWFQPGTKLLIDLGKTGDIAEVTLNGIKLGTLWKPPFEAEITSVLKKGENKLEIKVTNQWTNRLIGDQKAAPGKKILNSPLFVFPGRKMDDSGLIGPVTILVNKTINSN